MSCSSFYTQTIHFTILINTPAWCFAELVQHIVEKFLHPHLREYRSDIYYVGGSYEHTNVIASSDFDIQICLRMPKVRFYNILSTKQSLEQDRPGWAAIKGGAEGLLNNEGYMSTSKVCNTNQKIFFHF